MAFSVRVFPICPCFIHTPAMVTVHNRFPAAEQQGNHVHLSQFCKAGHFIIILFCNCPPVLPETTGYPFADITGKFIIKAPGQLSQSFHGQFHASVGSNQYYHVPFFHLRDSGHIHHELIHTDSSHNGRLLSADQNASFIGK